MTRLENLAKKLYVPALLAVAALGGLFGGGFMANAQAQNGRADGVLLEMREAFGKKDAAALQRLAPAVKDHPLADWAAYWPLKLQLDEALKNTGRSNGANPSANLGINPGLDLAVGQFLKRYSGGYLEDRLRADWLLLLGKRADWAAFTANYSAYRMRDDKEIECYALMLSSRPGGASEGGKAAAVVHKNWLSLREADEGCSVAAAYFYAQGLLSREQIAQKARQSYEVNRAGAAARANAIDSPSASEAALHNLIRLAQKDAAGAAAQLQANLESFNSSQAAWGIGAVGKALTLAQQDASAVYALERRGVLAQMADEHLAWRARSGLYFDKPARVKTSIEAMSEASQRDPTWVYWLARSRQRLGEKLEEPSIQALYRSIAGNKGFYEQLAQEALGERVSLPPAAAPLTAAEQQAAQEHPGLARALLAISIGLRADGVREWNYWTNLHTPGGMADRELLAAASVACKQEVWDRCINTSERTKGQDAVDMAQRFPTPLRHLVLQHSRAISLDPAYVYGLIRQESRFIMDARSHVGAAGLMQLMPRTAAWTARKIGIENFKAADVYEQDTNVRLGTAYLKLVLDDMNGSAPLAAAAYNAGPSRPRNWRKNLPTAIEAAAFAEAIPFAETRDYVKKVAANATNYALVLGTPQATLRQRLGTVSPRATGEREDKDLP